MGTRRQGILEPIEGNVEVTSSKEMLHLIDEANKRWTLLGNNPEDKEKLEEINEQIMIGADAEVLFPSMQAEISGEIVRKAVEESDVDIKGSIGERLLDI